MSKLEWELLTKKRGSSTSQGIPPGKEELLWVTGTVTLIYGERCRRIRFGKMFDTPARPSYSTRNSTNVLTRTEVLCQTTIPNRVRQVPPDASFF
jgi:hypothetical protein